ncbi:MAG: hypothetical protein U1F76_28760 [Candidatus Competibacteraceae bacterium]
MPESTRYDIDYHADGDGEQIEKRIRPLHAEQHTDKQIAARLNAEGYRTTHGGTFRFQTIWPLRQRCGLVKIQAGEMTPDRFRCRDGAYTILGIMQAVSVSKDPVQRWRKEGRLEGRQQGPYRPWRFHLTQHQRQTLRAQGKRRGDPSATRAECAQVEPSVDADGSTHL